MNGNNDTEHLWLKSYPESVDWKMQLKVVAAQTLLDDAAKQYGNKPAVDFEGKKTSWNELHDHANKMAKGLQSLGLKKGDKVGLFLPNSPYFIISYYAVLKAGGTVVNFNPLYAERELVHQIEDSETDIMITMDLHLTYDKMQKMLHATRLEKVIICPIQDLLPFPKNILFKLVKGKELVSVKEDKRRIFYSSIIDNDGKFEEVSVDPENDVALLQYTGGTTGLPKGAMLTHKNIVANTEQCAEWLGAGESDQGQGKMLGVLPFFHVFAMTVVMNLSIREGYEIICLPRFELEKTLKTIQKKKPTHFPAVPAIYTAINNFKGLGKYDLSSVSCCVAGGAPLPVEVKKKFEETTGCTLVEGYGLTESSPVACANPIVGENKAGSIGLPLPGTIVEIIDMENPGKIMPTGERGELCITGPQVMKGYWNKEEATKETLENGTRLHTGDVAIMDEDGYVYIVDRIKDMIITNGYNVYPRNVEEAIYLHPAVEECIVAGVPDKSRGEIVKAWIKIKEGRELTVEDIKEFLKDKISPMEIPKMVEFRDEPLPKTLIGKLSRKDILEEEKAKKQPSPSEE